MLRWTSSGGYLARQALTVAASATCASAVLWPLLRQPVPPRVQVALPVEQRSEQIAALSRELEQLKMQNAALHQQLSALQREVDSRPAAVAQIRPTEQAALPERAAQRRDLGAQEAAMAASAESWQSEFALLEEQFYGEPADADWAATMQRDMNRVEERLAGLTGASTSIRYHECHSSTCRVEFVHQGAAPAFLPALIASPSCSRVSTRTEHTENGEVTVALYQR